MNNNKLYPQKADFLDVCSKIMPISLYIIRAKECELFSRYIYDRPVLDIGCGEGEFAKILFKNKIDTGIDFKEKNIRKARKSNSYKNCIASSIENVNYNNNYFKSIISNCVLEHVFNLDKALSNVHNMLDNNGMVYFTVATDKFSKYMSFANYFGMYENITKINTKILNKLFNHNFALKKDEWDEKFINAGFKIVYDEPYLSKLQLNIMGLLLIFSFPSFLYKKTFNKWKIFPSIYRNNYFFQYLKKLNSLECNDGGCHFYILKKNV